MYTTETSVPEISSFKVEIATVKLERCKSPGTDEILSELFQAVDNTLCSEIHKLINCMLNKKELTQQ
jgi:hypothetical protein